MKQEKSIRDAIFYYWKEMFYFPREAVLKSGFPFRNQLRNRVRWDDDGNLIREIEISLFRDKELIHSKPLVANPIFIEAGFSSWDEMEKKAVGIALFLFNDSSIEIRYGGRSMSNEHWISEATPNVIARWLKMSKDEFEDLDPEADDETTE